MVRFLTKRPIAVIMAVLAVSVLGIVAFLTMPVSLLPDIDIPEIKVRVNYPNIDARNLENTVVKPLRQQLMQVSGLKEIESETVDGFSEIKLSFSYKTNTDYAYFEVNELVDAITGRFPREMERPLVIKLKPSDIPVFYLSIVPLKDFYKNGEGFQELSEYVETVVKRRIEQISDVSMVDISGLSKPQIIIRPFSDKLEDIGLSDNDIAEAIKRNNIQIGNLSFSEGHYVYRLRFKPSINTIDDFNNISLSKDGRLFKLGDLAEIKAEPNPEDGMFFYNGTRAVSMAVYKQADARMKDVSFNVEEAISNLKDQNTNIDFFIERDQTKLLEYSLRNLKQTLALGILFAMLVMFLFIRRYKLSLIISISIPVSLLISFFFLNISGISINIISLSGLILSVGLMIDNSIIVIDNINQHRLTNLNCFDATVAGTNEVIRPLISSVLTTCAVFVPMISLSGLAGAVFFDQAITITISLIISLFVSIMVIPVLYNLFLKNSRTSNKSESNRWLLSTYENLLALVMKRKALVLTAFFFLLPLGYLLFSLVTKEKFPEMKQTDMISKIEWNEPIRLSENKRRTMEVIDKMNSFKLNSSAYIGEIDFSLTKKERQLTTSSMIYLNFDSIINIDDISNKCKSIVNKEYPLANISFFPSENIFQTIFKPDDPAIKAKYRHKLNQSIDPAFVEKINMQLSDTELLNFNKDLISHTSYEIFPEHDKMLLYEINIQEVIKKLKLVFGGSEIDKISFGNKVVNIIIAKSGSNISEILSTETVNNKSGIAIPLKSILKYRKINNMRSIKSDKLGEYYSISIENNIISNDKIEDAVLNSVNHLKNIDVSLSGSVYEQELLLMEFIWVLCISFILLYLILAAQFESLLLPLIILIEIFFDIAGALFFLYIFNSSLNLMSALGIIVMSGIIINDSIIKIDTIRLSYNNGLPLLKAILEGGRRRFYPIVMTSLTTILALMPLLFFGGLGIELQIPLALAIIGGLLLGTIVSLFFIPIMFYYFARKTV